MDSVLERIQRLQQTCQQVVAEVILLSYELRHLKETEALKRELESAVIPPEKKQDRKPSPPRAAASSSRPKPKKRVPLYQPPAPITTEKEWFENHALVRQNAIPLTSLAAGNREYNEVSETQFSFDDEPALPSPDFAPDADKAQGKGNSRETSVQWLKRLVNIVLAKEENPFLTTNAIDKVLTAINRGNKDRKFRTMSTGEKRQVLSDFNTTKRFMNEVQAFIRETDSATALKM
jgi:hypothetical protein